MSLIAVSYVLTFCRAATGLLFLISSVSKARNVSQFKRAVANFRLLPKKLNSIAALFLLVGEFCVVALMGVGGSLLLPGFILAIFLLTIFCIAMSSVLVRKLYTSCNCFSTSNKPITVSDLCRNLGFIGCALGGSIIQSWQQTTHIHANLNWLEWILVSLSASVFIVIWIQLSEIAQLFHQS
jgi:hypothetical protein